MDELQEIDDTLAVREFREGKGWTQAEAAEWYGCATRSWRRYELAERPVPKPLLNRIKEKLAKERRKR